MSRYISFEVTDNGVSSLLTSTSTRAVYQLAVHLSHFYPVLDPMAPLKMVHWTRLGVTTARQKAPPITAAHWLVSGLGPPTDPVRLVRDNVPADNVTRLVVHSCDPGQ